MGDGPFLHATLAQALTAMNPAELGQAFGGDEAAVAYGLVKAQLTLGRMLLTGDNLACDRRAAFACFLSAAGGGNAEAQNLLGRCFENGWGTAVDREAVRNCYRLAANGCIAGALRWFERGVSGAPLPARQQMLKALRHHPRCAVRAFAMRGL